MAGTVTLRLKTQSVDRAIARLKAGAHVAIVRSLERAMVTARTTGSRSIATDMGVKMGDAKAVMQIKDGRVDRDHVISLEVQGNRIPLIKWVSNPRPGGRRRGGVTTRLPGSAKRYPHAFIAEMGSGHVGVFERVPGADRRGPAPHKSQLPIYQLYGPSFVKVFTKLRSGIAKAGQDALVKNLKHEFRWALDQARQGS